MDRCFDHRDITEIALKTTLNTTLPINHYALGIKKFERVGETKNLLPSFFNFFRQKLLVLSHIYFDVCKCLQFGRDHIFFLVNIQSIKP